MAFFGQSIKIWQLELLQAQCHEFISINPFLSTCQRCLSTGTIFASNSYATQGDVSVTELLKLIIFGRRFSQATVKFARWME